MAESKVNKRLESLDVLRGFDMFFIMGGATFIIALCGNSSNPLLVWLSTQMKHVEWDGMTMHDTIFPLFIFISGVTFPFSAKNCSSKASLIKKILFRSFALIVLGLICNLVPKFDFENLRYASVLARIGISWGIAALLFLYFKTSWRIAIVVVTLIAYWLASALLIAPDAPALASPFSIEGCYAGYIDRLFLPGRLYYTTFDPEGLFTTITAITTAMLGNFTGEFLLKKNISESRKALILFGSAVVLSLVAILWNEILPVNKKLWSSSFVCASAAYSVGLLSIFYYLIDVLKIRRWGFVFKVIGLNSITIYIAWRFINFNAIGGLLTCWSRLLFNEETVDIFLKGGYVVACWLFLYYLYTKKIFLKI